MNLGPNVGRKRCFTIWCLTLMCLMNVSHECVSFFLYRVSILLYAWMMHIGFVVGLRMSCVVKTFIIPIVQSCVCTSKVCTLCAFEHIYFHIPIWDKHSVSAAKVRWSAFSYKWGICVLTRQDACCFLIHNVACCARWCNLSVACSVRLFECTVCALEWGWAGWAFEVGIEVWPPNSSEPIYAINYCITGKDEWDWRSSLSTGRYTLDGHVECSHAWGK